MIIKREDVSRNRDHRDWIVHEFIASVGPVFSKEPVKDEYDVKFMIDDHVVEPLFFRRVMENVEKYIEERAVELLKEKLEDIHQQFQDKLSQLSEVAEDITKDLIQQFENNI